MSYPISSRFSKKGSMPRLKLSTKAKKNKGTNLKNYWKKIREAATNQPDSDLQPPEEEDPQLRRTKNTDAWEEALDCELNQFNQLWTQPDCELHSPEDEDPQLRRTENTDAREEAPDCELNQFNQLWTQPDCELHSPEEEDPQLRRTENTDARQKPNTLSSVAEDDNFSKSKRRKESSPAGGSETRSDEAPPIKLEGRRIVDVNFFIDQIKSMDDHPPFHCSFKDMVLVKESRYGLKSCITMKCTMCGIEKKLWTDNTSELVMDVNTSAVSGTVSTGGGHAQLEEIVSTMNIPCMNYRTFRRYHDRIADVWKEAAQKEMSAAVEEEKKEAIKRGEIDTDGVPLLTVVADGCWAKRSYRKNYNSLSGVAAIVGFYTKKVLFIGVKNKYCTLCIRAENKGKPAKDHACYKNWGSQQSATSMEPAIISEGFLCSEKLYGVRYARLIADGDSSVYQTILDKRPYKNLTVQKIECRNHLLRNYCNKIREIVNTSENRRFPITLRKHIGDNLCRLRYAVTKAIKFRKTENKINKITLLKEDILNGPFHVFGDHSKCTVRGYFCDGTDKRNNENMVPTLKQFGLFQKIEEAVRHLGLNASSLIQDVDSNYAEHYNKVVAKFVGGKRINFTKSRSYEARCEGAVVQHNSGIAHYKFHKTMLSSSPGTYCKSITMKRKRSVEKAKEKRANKPKIRCALFPMKSFKTDKDYGPNVQRPDLTIEEFEEEKKLFLEKLCLDADQRIQLEKRTILQSSSAEWHEERRKRVCASTFGKICKRRPHTSCESLVRNLLYRSGTLTDAMAYGTFHEEIALQAVQDKLGKKIEKCGLIVDEVLPYVAATPDGIIEDGEGIVEIKCPQKICDEHPREAARSGVLKFLSIKNNAIEIKKNHDYFYQIQGQLRVTKRSYCLLCVWSPKGLEIIKVKRDNEFWSKEIEPRIHKFYYDCILPELVDPRHPRSMPIRNPAWIIAAQEKVKEKKKNK